jgi:hypothetical protein
MSTLRARLDAERGNNRRLVGAGSSPAGAFAPGLDSLSSAAEEAPLLLRLGFGLDLTPAPRGEDAEEGPDLQLLLGLQVEEPRFGHRAKDQPYCATTGSVTNQPKSSGLVISPGSLEG